MISSRDDLFLGAISGSVAFRADPFRCYFDQTKRGLGFLNYPQIVESSLLKSTALGFFLIVEGCLMA